MGGSCHYFALNEQQRSGKQHIAESRLLWIFHATGGHHVNDRAIRPFQNSKVTYDFK